MIYFENTGKAYRTRKGDISWVFRNLDIRFADGVSVGILAPSGQGKTTFIDVAAGNELPSEGRIYRQGHVSWPFSFRGNVNARLSGRQNLRFLTDVYGTNFKEAYDFVSEFSELGRYLDMPMKNYTAEMRSRLSISALFSMGFTTILVDEAMEGGDAAFRRRCAQHIADNANDLTFLIATSNVQLVTRYCQRAGVLNEGILTMYDTVDAAVEEFNKVNLEFI